MKSVKSKILGLLGLIVILILIITWFYPFSPLSVYKNFSYRTDSYSVKNHNSTLNDLQKLYDESSSDDVTTNALQHLSGLYEQDWLVKNDSFQMNKDVLDKMLFDVQQVRNQLLNLTTREEYTWEQRTYLRTLIENLLSMEETIESMMDDKWDNRTVLNRRFFNLHGGFTSSLMFFNTFYDTTQYR